MKRIVFISIIDCSFWVPVSWSVDFSLLKKYTSVRIEEQLYVTIIIAPAAKQIKSETGDGTNLLNVFLKEFP